MLKGRVLLGLLMCACISQASIIVTTTILTGPNESPPVPSAGIGNATVTIDTVANTLTVNVSFSGLTSGTTASHIHCCTLPTAGVATTTPTFAGFPLGVTSGSYINTLDLLSASSYNPAFVTANGGIPGAEAALVSGISSGIAYLNIHTTNFPNGEIRGFLTAVPEPGTVLLLSAGLAGLLIAKRRAA